MKTSKHKNGFTLIELLVVIAIIALLVSILLPSLKTAKELAKRATCAVNLRSCGTGINLYAAEWNSSLPLHANGIHDIGTVGAEGRAPILPWRTYLAYWVNSWADSFNLASLYEEQFIDAAGIFYCPSQTNSAHSYDTYKDIWAMSEADRRNEAIKVSYCYNPYNVNGDRPYATLSDVDITKPLVMDIPLSRDMTSHSKEPGWNVLFPDSSVRFVKSQLTWDILLNDALNTWGSFDGYTGCHGVMNQLAEDS